MALHEYDKYDYPDNPKINLKAETRVIREQHIYVVVPASNIESDVDTVVVHVRTQTAPGKERIIRFHNGLVDGTGDFESGPPF